MQTGRVDLARTAALCLAGVLILVWLELSNDFFETMGGSRDHRHASWINVTQSPRAVFLAAHAALLAGAGLLFRLLLQSPHIASKMLYAVICFGYLYLGPPFRLSHQGLGEVLCFLASGPLAVNAFYLAQGGHTLCATSYVLSVLVGVTTTVTLFCSHFYRARKDLAEGRRSALQLIGEEKGAKALKVTVGLVHVLTLAASVVGILPLTCWTSVMVAYGVANAMVSLAEKEVGDPEALRPLTLLAAKWHILFTAMLCLGLVLKRAMLS